MEWLGLVNFAVGMDKTGEECLWGKARLVKFLVGVGRSGTSRVSVEACRISKSFCRCRQA